MESKTHYFSISLGVAQWISYQLNERKEMNSYDYN